MAIPEEPITRYLNTDLDLVSEKSLDHIAQEIERLGVCVSLTHGEDGRCYMMSESCHQENEPEASIVELLNAIDSLSPAGKESWAACSKREFNIGYDCGDEPWAFQQGLSNPVLKRMTNCGATLGITLYPFRLRLRMPPSLCERFRKFLAERGGRLSQIQESIAATVLRFQGDFTAEDLRKRMENSRVPRASRSTLLRTLEHLHAAGLLERRELNGELRYRALFGGDVGQ